jgi:hypothetical protein
VYGENLQAFQQPEVHLFKPERRDRVTKAHEKLFQINFISLLSYTGWFEFDIHFSTREWRKLIFRFGILFGLFACFFAVNVQKFQIATTKLSPRGPFLLAPWAKKSEKFANSTSRKSPRE